MKDHVIGCLTIIADAILSILIGGWIALWLWEAIMVTVFGLPMLNIWQVWGLIWLTHIIIPHSTTITKTYNKD